MYGNRNIECVSCSIFATVQNTIFTQIAFEINMNSKIMHLISIFPIVLGSLPLYIFYHYQDE